MHDERVACRSAFGGEDLGNGRFIQGVGAQPIDRFCGKGDQSTGANRPTSNCDRISLWRNGIDSQDARPLGHKVDPLPNFVPPDCHRCLAAGRRILPRRASPSAIRMYINHRPAQVTTRLKQNYECRKRESVGRDSVGVYAPLVSPEGLWRISLGRAFRLSIDRRHRYHVGDKRLIQCLRHASVGHHFTI